MKIKMIVKLAYIASVILSTPLQASNSSADQRQESSAEIRRLISGYPAGSTLKASLMDALEKENAVRSLDALYQTLVEKVSGDPNPDKIKEIKKEDFFNIHQHTFAHTDIREVYKKLHGINERDPSMIYHYPTIGDEEIIELAKAQKTYGEGKYNQYNGDKMDPLFMFDCLLPTGEQFPCTLYGFFSYVLKGVSLETEKQEQDTSRVIRAALNRSIRDTLILTATQKKDTTE